MLASVQYRLMLCLDRDDMITFAAVHLEDPLDRQVVTFRSPAGKDDLF